MCFESLSLLSVVSNEDGSSNLNHASKHLGRSKDFRNVSDVELCHEMGSPADGVAPCEAGRATPSPGASGENPRAAGRQPESSYVAGRAAAACSKILTALPTSATPKITNAELVPGSAPL